MPCCCGLENKTPLSRHQYSTETIIYDPGPFRKRHFQIFPLFCKQSYKDWVLPRCIKKPISEAVLNSTLPCYYYGVTSLQKMQHIWGCHWRKSSFLGIEATAHYQLTRRTITKFHPRLVKEELLQLLHWSLEENAS